MFGVRSDRQLPLRMISLTTRTMYEELSSELLALNQTWRYVHDMTSDLFGADTLNRASAPYFGTVLNALWAYGLTLLSRLLDPAKTGKRENCSLSAMASAAGSLTPELMHSLDEIRAQSKQLLEYRNKEIAHRDRVTTLQDDQDQEQLFSWVRMHETIAELNRWMNNFESLVGLSVQCYDFPEGWGDVDEVRHILKKGMSALRTTPKPAQ